VRGELLETGPMLVVETHRVPPTATESNALAAHLARLASDRRGSASLDRIV
jgi:hypothetical protein